MSEGKTFVDSNILVYGYDNSARDKHKLAQEVLVDLWNSGAGMISTQVLQEFFVNVTRKIPRPLPLTEARQIVADFLKWSVVIIEGPLLLRAIDLQGKYELSFWDSMILSAAIKGGATRVYSEDLQDGFKIGHM